MIKKILSCFLVLTLLCQIAPLNYMKVSANFSPQDSSSLQISGNIEFMYRPHGGDSRRDAPFSGFDITLNYWVNTRNGERVENEIIDETDENGYFNFRLPYESPLGAGATITVRASDVASFIVNSTSDVKHPSRAISRTFSETLDYETGNIDFGTLSLDSSASNAFNILRTIRRAYDFVNDIEGATIPGSPVPVVLDNNSTGDEISYLNPSKGYIYIHNAHRNLQSIYLHEYGHFVMWKNSTHPMVGGEHTENRNRNERFTFSEGWANFFASAVLESSRFFSFSWERNGRCIETLGDIRTSAPNTFNQWLDAAAMWDVIDAYNPAEPWDNVERSFSESWNSMRSAMQNAGSSLGKSRATLQDFYNEYVAEYITQNSDEAYDFWRVFNENERQFDNTPPEVEIISIVAVPGGLGSHFVTVRLRDNVKVDYDSITAAVGTTRRNSSPATVETIRPIGNNRYELYIPGRYFTVGQRNRVTITASDYAGKLADDFNQFQMHGISVHPLIYASPTFNISDANYNAEELQSISNSTSRIPRTDFGVGIGYVDLGDDETNRIAVVPGGWDNIGAVLSNMNIPFDTIFNLTNYDILSQYDIIFVNCSSSPDSEAVRQFVEDGGILYASDLSGYGLQQVFPNLTFAGAGGNIANIIDTGLATHVGATQMEIHGIWGAIATQIPSDANVYVTHPNGLPLVFSFKYGEGQVFYTSFHNSSQATGLMTSFLEYLIFSMEHSLNEDELINMAESNGYEYLGAVFARLMSGEISEFFAFTPNPGHDFRLMLDSSMGNFFIKLIDPLGRIFFANQSGIVFPSEAIIQHTPAMSRVAAVQANAFTLNDDLHLGCCFEERQYIISKLDELPLDSNSVMPFSAAFDFTDSTMSFTATSDFMGFYDLDTTVVSLEHQGVIVTNPIPGEWQFAVISGNTIDNVTTAIGIAEKPQAPMIINACEISALQSGHGVVASGIAPVDGQVHWLLVDSEFESVAKSSIYVNAGDDFNISLPNIPVGNYNLLIQAENEAGLISGIIFVDILIDNVPPEIIIDERYEQQIFEESVIFDARAVNAADVAVYLNGQSVEVWPVWIFGLYGNSTANVTVELNLAQGQNEVLIIATSATGIVTERTIYIASDTVTPKEQRPMPVITDISLQNRTTIYEPTTITFRVENANLCDTDVNVSFDSLDKDVIYLGNDAYVFTFDPALHTNSPDVLRQIHIRAENRWRNRDDAFVGIFVCHEDDGNTVTPTPVGQTIYDMQLDTRLPQIATTSIPFLNRVHGTGTTFSVNMNSDPRTVTVNARTGTSQGIRFNMRDINDIVKPNHEYRLEATGRLINPAETSMARFRIESPPSDVDPILALAPLSSDGSFRLSHTLTQEEIWVLRNASISIGNTGGSYNIVYTGILIIEICIDCCEICGCGDCECCKCTVLCLDCGKCLDCECTCEDIIFPVGNVIYDMQSDTRLPEIATRSIPFLNRVHGTGTTFTVNMNSDPRTVTVNSRTGTSQGIRFNMRDVSDIAKPNHEYRIEATGRLINPAETSMARFRIETPPSGVEPVLALTQLRADGSFRLTHTLTQEEVWTLRNSTVSIGNTGGSYNIVYTGIIISEICIDCCEICGCGIMVNQMVNYVVTNSWGNNQTVEITITNIGDEPIRNWALQYDFNGTITNMWNGRVHSENIVRSEMYNSDIAPGASVTFGYTLTNATGEAPDNFILTSFRTAREEGYAVDLNVLHDWGSGFTGTITITNTSDTPIMAWELSFNTNFAITDPGNFLILESLGNNYRITGTFNGNIPIPADTSIVLQFNGVQTENPPGLSNVSLTEMVIP